MARAPFQVLVYPYRQIYDGEFEYALFKRADAGWWQGVAGGGENKETPVQAAKRETKEEAGIHSHTGFVQLDTIIPVRVTEFSNNHIWGEEIYVIPMYCFGVMVKEGAIMLSHEHTEYRWLSYQEADRLMKYDGNRTALWELDKRLRGRGPRGNNC